MYVHHHPGKRSPQNALTAAAELVLFSFAALLLLSLSGGLFSPQALAYEEDIEKEAVKAAIEAFLHSYAEEAMQSPRRRSSGHRTAARFLRSPART